MAAITANKKKVVVLLDLHENDEREKRKVLKAASAFPGLDMISIDMKERKLTVVGLVDPIEFVTKLRKHWHADILFVGPPANDGGGGGGKKEGDNKHQEEEVTATTTQPQTLLPPPPPPRYPYQYTYQPPPQPQPRPRPHGRHYTSYGAQDNDPNSCVIC